MPDTLPSLADIPQTRLGGLPIAALSLEETASFMAAAAHAPRSGRPLHLTSANGEVISRCHRDPALAALFRRADLINADGQPLVVASRLVGARPLPERVATTDLYPVMARRAEAEGLTFYLLGATEDENRRAVERTQAQFPRLRVVGRSHGYLRGAELDAKIDEINGLRPDILWLALGVPHEQLFAERYAARLPEVGMIKTSGGLFNFLSGSRRRAPDLVQAASLEWAWRLAQEPRRLFWRYTLTNPHAAYLLLRPQGGGPARGGVEQAPSLTH